MIIVKQRKFLVVEIFVYVSFILYLVSIGTFGVILQVSLSKKILFLMSIWGKGKYNMKEVYILDM